MPNLYNQGVTTKTSSGGRERDNWRTLGCQSISCWTRCNGNSQKKRLPPPGRPSTSINPPICSSSCLHIARPRPVPGARSCPSTANCSNGMNSVGRILSVIPGPSSSTPKRTVASDSSVHNTTSPRKLNLMALERRLWSTCRTRCGSIVSRAGSAGSSRSRNCNRLDLALLQCTAATCSHSSVKSVGWGERESLLFSLRLKSSTSLSRPSSSSPA